MKRLGAIVILALMTIALSASVCFADTGNLEINDVYPKDKATGTSVDNLSIKLWFNEDVIPKNDKIKKANEDAVKLIDEKGKEIDIMIKYNPDKDKKGQVIVLANAVSATSGDKKSKKAKIQSDTKYTFAIDKNFQASNGDKLAEDKKISFTTVDQAQATRIQMLLMGVMVAVMVILSVRSQKKEQEKKQEAQRNKNKEKVNPYKVAKKTGKSVEDVVRKDKEKKAKQAAADERKRVKEEKQRKKIEEHIRNRLASDNKRVSGPRPISAAGSTYVAKKAVQAEDEAKSETKKSTNPKNKTGKQKNRKK